MRPGLPAFFEHKVYKQNIHCTHSYVKRWKFCTPCFKKILFLKICTQLYPMVYITAALSATLGGAQIDVAAIISSGSLLQSLAIRFLKNLLRRCQFATIFFCMCLPHSSMRYIFLVFVYSVNFIYTTLYE